MHLTVVRKQRHRLGQDDTGSGPSTRSPTRTGNEYKADRPLHNAIAEWITTEPLNTHSSQAAQPLQPSPGKPAPGSGGSAGRYSRPSGVKVGQCVTLLLSSFFYHTCFPTSPASQALQLASKSSPPALLWANVITLKFCPIEIQNR